MSIFPKNDPEVSRVMMSITSFPVVEKEKIIKETLEKMSFFKIGITCIVDNKSKLLGLITDGDIRRMLLNIQKPLSALFMEDVNDHMTLNPFTIYPETKFSEAISLMEQKKIWDLPVVDKNQKLVGLFHLHPAVDFLIKSSKFKKEVIR